MAYAQWHLDTFHVYISEKFGFLEKVFQAAQPFYFEILLWYKIEIFKFVHERLFPSFFFYQENIGQE